jgi:hypothetical protein
VIINHISYQKNQELAGRLLITKLITESKFNKQPTLVITKCCAIVGIYKEPLVSIC